MSACCHVSGPADVSETWRRHASVTPTRVPCGQSGPIGPSVVRHVAVAPGLKCENVSFPT